MIIFIFFFFLKKNSEIIHYVFPKKSTFSEAIPHILKEEGGLVNDKNDRGGITNYGISMNFLTNLVHKNPALLNKFGIDHSKGIDNYDIIHMTQKEAEGIYKHQWWNKYNYGKLNYQPLADKILDISVNMGPTEAALFLVKACNKLRGVKFSFKTNAQLSIQLVDYINFLSKKNKKKIIDELKTLSLQHYIEIAKNDPSQRKFLRGWIQRAMN